MYGLNKVQLIGNMGRDPEMRMTQSGVPVTTFSMATNESYKRSDGNLVEKSEWHNIVAWRKLAEIINQHGAKGTTVYIGGKLQTRNYEKDGQRHYVTEIVADEFMMLNGRSGTVENQEPAVESYDQSPNESEDDLPF